MPSADRRRSLCFSLCGWRAVVPCWLAVVPCWLSTVDAPARAASLRLTVTDQKTGKPIPFRMHLKNKAGRPKKPLRAPFWRDHFVSEGNCELKLTPGVYTFEIERGPEYLTQSGHFVLSRDSEDEKTVPMRRFVNMAELGWYAGDLHVHRPVKDVPLLMRAEDLYVCPVITWWNKRNEWSSKKPPENPLVRFDVKRFYHPLAGEDERGGGALLYFNLKQPLEIQNAEREFPSSMKFLQEAAQQSGAWIDIEKPFWWDVPLWLASGKCDSIGLANNHMCRDQMLANEAWGKPRDKNKFPGNMGNGFWTQEIYAHIINCGIHLPPSAGSASGVLPNPVGYNRVYVHVDGEFTHEKWWSGLKAGRCFVTNGPMLRVKANGELPGTVFTAGSGREMVFKCGVALSTRDKIRYLEVVKNGETIHTIPLTEFAKQGGRLPELTFRESGWFLIRAVADNPKTFRFASTAPFYVRFDGKDRVSKKSTQFFLDWIDERVAGLKLDDPEQRKAVLARWEVARKFWENLHRNANAE
ncbi:MAG: CehA/McbA family metallohydrolase [Planctomycetales bacterium]